MSDTIRRLKQALPEPIKAIARRGRSKSRSLTSSVGDAYWNRVGPAAERIYAQYYDRIGRQTWQNTRWRGVTLYKLPTDLWIYQELLYELKPALIIETGTFRGGSAFYLASLLQMFGSGRVVTVELNPRPRMPNHPRIEYLVGSSTAPEIVARMTECAQEADGPVVVILDSYHGRDHVLAELEAYHALVTPGSYLIVEDTAHNGHPIKKRWGPGPWEAVEMFLPRHPEFTPDRDREKFMHTQNPRGYLKRS